jgi:putative intracellular protease/amidase
VTRVLVVCARRYNGHELWTALGIIKEAGIAFDLVSTDYVIQDEITGRPNRIKKLVYDVEYDPERYSGLMIVSGNMADTEAYWKDEHVLGLFDAAEAAGHAIAAICCSVPTSRRVAGGKKVSYYPLVRSKQLLRDAGAVLQTVALTRDRNLVTAEHQMASQMWAEEFVALIKGEPPIYTLSDSGFTPQGRERMPIKAIEAIRVARGLPPTVIRNVGKPS